MPYRWRMWSEMALGEEHAVALVPNLGKDGRLPSRVRGKGKAISGMRGPVDGRVRLDELAAVAARGVADLTALHHAAPLEVIGDGCRGRRPIADRVWDAAKVHYGLIREVHGSPASAQVDTDVFIRDPHGPEQPAGVGVNAEVEVVLLGREAREVILTSVEVQSDKAKGTLVVLPIYTDVLAGHE